MSNNCNKLFDLTERNDFLDSDFCANVIGIENNSPYFEFDEYLNYNRMAAACENRYIMTLFLNIRSMNANFSEFIEDFYVEKTEYDFLSFTETRLTDDVVSLYRMENYNIFANCRNSHVGGVAIYDKKKYSAHVIEHLTMVRKELESIFLHAVVGWML